MVFSNSNSRTTSSARLHLLEGIYAVLSDPSGHTRILYMDTGKLQGKSDQKHGISLDSLIYEYDAAFGDPLEHLGWDHLGSWKLEYPEYDIIEYVSCGSKGKHDRKNIINE